MISTFVASFRFKTKTVGEVKTFFNKFQKYLFSIILIFGCSGLLAQKVENKGKNNKKMEMCFEGMLAASAGKEYYAFNDGA